MTIVDPRARVKIFLGAHWSLSQSHSQRERDLSESETRT